MINLFSACSMGNYRIIEELCLGDAARVMLLNVHDNVSVINREIIPESQLLDISRYRFKRDSDKRLVARSFLYEYLYTQYAINNFELSFNSYQKPSLRAMPDLHFSLSYSGDLILVAVSYKKKMGADIEYINADLNIVEIAPSIMCQREFEYFASLSDDPVGQRHFFFKLFSVKESIIKAFGSGLYYPVEDLNTIDDRIFQYNGVFFESTPLLARISDRFCLAISLELAAC